MKTRIVPTTAAGKFDGRPTPWAAEGWGKPIGSALRHYLRKQRSLCGTWGYFGDVLLDKSTAGKCEACAAAHRGEG
jgi:hypothetical protein